MAGSSHPAPPEATARWSGAKDSAGGGIQAVVEASTGGADRVGLPRGRARTGNRMSPFPAQRSRRLAAAAGALLLLLCGCASTAGRQGPGPAHERWRQAWRHAARSPAAWVPAVAAAGVAAGGWDREISDWARRETPVFGSTGNARRASDALLAASQLGMIATVFAVPPRDPPAPSRFRRLVWEESAVLADAALVDGLKRAVRRERPSRSSGLSFPSGHSAGAFASAALAARNLRASDRSPGARRGLTAGMTTLAAGTAWARVEAGAHYPTDVLAGAALGGFVGVLVHDAVLGPAAPAMLALELGPDRRALVVRVSF